MKAIYEHFTDEEFELLLKAKGKQTWHDFILESTNVDRWATLLGQKGKKHD